MSEDTLHLKNRWYDPYPYLRGIIELSRYLPGDCQQFIGITLHQQVSHYFETLDNAREIQKITVALALMTYKPERRKNWYDDNQDWMEALKLLRCFSPQTMSDFDKNCEDLAVEVFNLIREFESDVPPELLQDISDGMKMPHEV